MSNGITTKQRDKIVVIVKKRLYPLWAALFITATKDVLGITKEDMLNILKTANRYAGYHLNGTINVNDLKKNIEKDLGEKLENFLRI